MSNLKIRNLSIEFGGVKALKDVSFEIEAGSFLGLMGPNGAGKTSVINCISRISNPSSGEITFDGHNLLALHGHEILKIGISRTFQDLNFFDKISDMMILDFLVLGQFDSTRNSLISDGLQLRRSKNEEHEAKRNARKVLEFFRDIREQLEPPEKERDYPFLHGREGFPDLIDVEYEKVSSLSFAWRKRLDLARALVSKPKLLLLDEPAQGLPPAEIENLGRLLKLIQKELQVSALIVEHNVFTLSKISNKMLVMSAGEIIADGLPESVIADPKVIEIYLGSPSTSENDKGSVPRKVREIEVAEKPLLEVKNLDVFYGHAQVVFKANIKVFSRQVVALLGTNGSGKSTILRAISGIEKPKFGEIVFKGENVPLGWPEVAVERGVQYVPQGHIVFPDLSVYDNFRIGAYAFKLKNKKNIKERLEKALYYFPDLRDFLDAQAASLSGGQQQMLAIGQALMGQPELLLLDEPSLGLSPILVDRLFEIIKKISREESCSVLIVEQNVRRALDVSDYIYLLSAGVLMNEGSRKHFTENDETIRKYLGFS